MRRRATASKNAWRAALVEFGRGCVLTAAVGIIIFAAAAVAIIVFLGPQPPVVQVPNLIGMTEDQARQEAAAVGLSCEVAGERYDDTIPAGKVSATDPAPGRMVRKGRKIRIILSKGPRNAVVPNLLGKTLEEAKLDLVRAQLDVGEVAYRRSSKPRDTVIGQSLPPGTRLPPGSPVDLYVSGGEDFGRLRLPDGTVKLFRRVVVKVPNDGDYHRVVVELKHGRLVRTVYDRIQAPGERAEVDVVAERGDKLRVIVDDEEILTRRIE